MGTRVNLDLFGVSFVIPDGWVGVVDQPVPGAAPQFMLKSNINQGIAIVLPQASTDIDEVAAFLNKQHQLAENLFFLPSITPQVDGPWVIVTGTLATPGALLSGMEAAFVREDGIGVIFVLDFPERERRVFRLMTGELALSTTTTPQKVDISSSLAKEWQQRLSGMLLSFTESSTFYDVPSPGDYASFRKKVDFILCGDGPLLREGSDATEGQGDGSFANQGQWRIFSHEEIAYLEARLEEGTIKLLRLDRVGDETYAGGDRWLVDDAGAACQ